MNPATKQLQNISELYDEWAEHYDVDCVDFPAYAHLDSVYDKILDTSSSEYNDDLTVELGCGTGIHSSILIRKSKNVVAIDISSQCILFARKKLKASGFDNRIQFVKCDAMHLPFRDNVARSVVSLGLLTCHTDGCRQIINEISRILKHKGNFLLDVQNKYSPNIIYYFLDALTRGRFFKLGFSSMRDFKHYLKSGKVSWIYRNNKKQSWTKVPFSTFSLKEINSMLYETNLVQDGFYGAHFFTLIIPLEYQERKLSKKLSSVLLFMGRFEALLKNALARYSSVVIFTGHEK